jgi:signal transduction histidine kinase
MFRFLATCAVVALGVAAVVQAHRYPAAALPGGRPAALTLVLVAGLGAWLAGLHLAGRRSARLAGGALAAAGPALFLAALPQPESGGALALTAALALGPTAPALAGTAALAYPRAHRGDLVVAAAALVATGLWLGLLATLTFDPSATGCFACPRNLLHVGGSEHLHDVVLHSGLYASALTCAAAAVIALVRGQARRWAPAAAAGLGAAGFAVAAANGAPTVEPATRALWLAECAALALAAGAVALEVARSRRLSARIAGLVAGALPSPEALRTAFGDPGLEIVFPRAAGAVDADGQAAASPRPAVAVTEVTRGSQVVAELRHDGAQPERIAAAARGAGLALEHASLRARLRAELADLAASRARIVAVGDAERRRLERDLHDGAQQRLIALSMDLEGRAREEVRLALADLRALAHGIHPAALSDAGLEAALLELADESDVPLRIVRVPAGRLDPAIESAAYRLVLDGVACAGRAGDGRAVRLAIERTGDRLDVRLELPGVPPASASVALQHAADRFAALSGALTVGSVVEGSVPCGS